MSESIVLQHAHTGWNDLPGALLNTFIKQLVWYYKIKINLLSPLGLFYVTKLATLTKSELILIESFRNIYFTHIYHFPTVSKACRCPSLALWSMSCGTDTILIEIN